MFLLFKIKFGLFNPLSIKYSILKFLKDIYMFKVRLPK